MLPILIERRSLPVICRDATEPVSAASLTVMLSLGDAGLDCGCHCESALALIAANAVGEYFAVSPGQVLNFISTSTSTGYVSLTEMS